MNKQLVSDPYFKVDVLSKSLRPQTLAYLAAHNDYSEDYIYDECVKKAHAVIRKEGGREETRQELYFLDPFGKEIRNLQTTSAEGIKKSFDVVINQNEISEKIAGERLVNKVIKFGHFGVLEHPSIIFSTSGFPHTTMQQIRTHRVGISVDCQSGRYTGQRVANLGKLFGATKALDTPNLYSQAEKIFYLRPTGTYTDRQGKKYEYIEKQRNEDLHHLMLSAYRYHKRLEKGFSEEHAREVYTPYAIRQNFVISLNARSLMHILDLRAPADAQLEIRQMAYMMFEHFKNWMPEVATWYEANRLGKSRLAP